MIHADDRHGPDWPRKAGWRGRWTGWLTYREYDVIESQLRFGHTNMKDVGRKMGLIPTGTERMFYTLVEVGLVEGSPDFFEVTPMAKILFDMTDQYILEIDLSDEDEGAA